MELKFLPKINDPAYLRKIQLQDDQEPAVQQEKGRKVLYGKRKREALLGEDAKYFSDKLQQEVPGGPTRKRRRLQEGQIKEGKIKKVSLTEE